MSTPPVGNNLPAKENRPLEVPKPVKTAEGIWTASYFGSIAASSFVEALNKTSVRIPPQVTKVAAASPMYAGIGALFAIPNLISNIHTAILTSSVVERVKSICRAVLDLGAIATAANGILLGLKAIGVVAKNAIPWTSICNIVLFPLQFIELGLDLHKFSETHGDRKEILAKISRPNAASLKEKRISNLTDSCEYVIQNKDRLRKMLILSKKTVIDQRAQDILNGVHSQNEEEQKAAIEKGEAFMQILRRRINTKYNLEVATVAVKATGVAASAISLFVPPNPATLGIVGICGVATVALFGLEKLMLNKDPFSAPRNVWYEKMAHRMRQIVYRVADSVEAICKKIVHVAEEGRAAILDRCRIRIPVTA